MIGKTLAYCSALKNQKCFFKEHMFLLPAGAGLNWFEELRQWVPVK
jgi:hypothetical protein